jgi:hypothetical protein
LNLGDTFLWDPEYRGNEHLYIVITAPDQEGKFVAINLTKSNHGPLAITLKIGDHSFITKYDSDANFADAVIASVSIIQQAIKSRQAVMHDPMNITHVERIGKAAKKNPACSFGVQKRCKIQWP